MGTSLKLAGVICALGAAVTFGASRDKLVGVVDYKGGFAPDMVVRTPPGEFVKFFRIAIPAFCQGAEVLEAHTSVQGQKDQAKLYDHGTSTYAVNQGNGQRIDSILISLNGPTGVACSVPVYIVEEPGTHDPDPEPEPGPDPVITNLQLCNRTPRQIYVALGTKLNGDYVSQGWYRINAHRCATPAVKGGISGGEVYVRGESRDGITWGVGPAFCVAAQPFYSNGNECKQGTPGFRWAAFSQHLFTPGLLLTIQFQ